MILENKGSLITFKDEDGQDRCLGYLLDAPGKGIFEPYFGRVDVTSEEAKIHNACLSKAEIEGLDNNCQIGQMGCFYLCDKKVKTWPGDEVSSDVVIKGNSITFSRKGKVFQGILRKGTDCFNFERTA